jgi:hypothetical protein
VKATNFLGRAFNDILLELFYYELGKKLTIESKTSKNWLGLLVGDKKNNKNECGLRYFNRSTGTFTISPRCDEGGYSVCQSQPIFINDTITNPSEKNIKLELTTNEIPSTIISYEAADENLDYDGISFDYSDNTFTRVPDYNETTHISSTTNNTNQKPDPKYPLVKIITFSLLALIVLLGTVYVVYYLLRDRGSYSAHHRRGHSKSQKKHLPTAANPNETSNTSAILYTPVETVETYPPPIPMDEHVINSVENSHAIIDVPNENIIAESNEEEEPFKATLKSPNDE